MEEWQSCFSTSFINVKESSASSHNGAMWQSQLMLIQQTRDQRSCRLAAYGTRGTKEPYNKTSLDNITGVLWLARAAAFNLLGLNCDAAYTRYLQSPNRAKRTLWQDIKSSTS